MLVRRDVNHVRPVLAGAHDPIDFLGLGIKAADGFGGFRGEPDFAADEVEAMGATQWAKIDGRQSGLMDEVDSGEGVEGAKAVVRDVRGGAVGGGDDFVGIMADGDASEDLEGGGVDDGQGLGALGEHQQRLAGRALGVELSGKKEAQAKNCKYVFRFHGAKNTPKWEVNGEETADEWRGRREGKAHPRAFVR